MPFNSASYSRNKWRRDAIAELRRAREHKRQAAAEHGDAAQYHLGRASLAVRLARSSWRLYLIQCRVCRLSSRAAPYRPAPFSTRESES